MLVNSHTNTWRWQYKPRVSLRVYQSRISTMGPSGGMAAKDAACKTGSCPSCCASNPAPWQLSWLSSRCSKYLRTCIYKGDMAGASGSSLTSLESVCLSLSLSCSHWMKIQRQKLFTPQHSARAGWMKWAFHCYEDWGFIKTFWEVTCQYMAAVVQNACPKITCWKLDSQCNSVDNQPLEAMLRILTLRDARSWGPCPHWNALMLVCKEELQTSRWVWALLHLYLLTFCHGWHTRTPWPCNFLASKLQK